MIPKFSVKKPFTVAVGVIMVIVLGIVSFTKMTTDLLPSMDLPYVMVNTVYPGASPEKVETSVTKPLEQVLATTSGLKNITSVSNENSSLVMLEFNQDVNMDSAMIDMSGKIDMVRGHFDDSVNSPMIMKMNPDMMPIMMLSIDVDGMDIKEVTKFVNNNILPEFERIEGVATVETMGLVEDQLKVTLNQDKIDAINKKILANLDSEFSKQEKPLNDAKSSLNKSKAELDKQKKNQSANLEKASKELQSAKKQLQGAVDSIGMSKEELQEQIDNATIELATVKVQINNLKASLEKIPEGAVDQIAGINAQIKALEEVSQKIKDGIDGAKKGIQAIDSLAEIEAKEKELESGKMTLEKELSSAENEIKKGETEINQGLTQLKDAKEQAKKGASISDKITPEMIGNILMAENFNMPAGYIKENEVEYSVKVGDKFKSAKELENLLLFNVDINGVGDINLKDVADIEFTDNAHKTYTNINGNDGVMLAFQKSSGFSTADVTEMINEKIESLSKANENMHITTLMDQGVYINMVVNSVLSNLLYGGLLAIAVLLLFLRSFKTTLVIAFSIPISLMFAMVLMYFSGVTLNIISLSGLALGVGMLVDNSIVVIENIYRLRSKGMSAPKAAVHGARQVSGAIFASTLTTICVFLPIVFTSGMTKQLFVDMGLTIAYSLLASLLVALTVVPSMSSNLLNKVNEKEHNLFDKFINVYEVVLRKSLAHKWIVIILALGLLGFSGYKTLTMGTSFMPSMDSTQMSVSMEMPKDSKRSDKLAMSDEFIKRVRTIEDVETVGAMEGSSMGPMGASDMSFYIILKEDKKHSNIEIEDMINEKIENMDANFNISASNMDMSALGGAGVQIQIKGTELDEIQKIANDIADILKNIEGTIDVSNGMEDSNNETRIIVDKNKAMEYGLSVAQVYSEISKVLETEKSSTDITIEHNEYPVIIAHENDMTRDNILDYKIKGTKDNESIEIKLSKIAHLENAKALTAINRDNQSRYLNVSAGIDSNHNIGLVSREIEDALENYKVPEAYTIELKGENETIVKSFIDLTLMGAMAILFVYLIMVAQFQSLLSPFIVMFTIPLAFTGGLLALLITGNELSVISMLGFLVLCGVVVNNGIVFVDYTNQLRLSGMSKKDAIIETGRARIRPILMTATTTILAMSTMAAGVGMGAEMSQGLAIVTIGGLMYGTLLTLLIIPILYDLLHRRELKPIDIEED
ncbi:MAG: efflux RND transporter permease subunit [Peptostreptococcaceae bacterium]